MALKDQPEPYRQFVLHRNGLSQVSDVADLDATLVALRDLLDVLGDQTEVRLGYLWCSACLRPLVNLNRLDVETLAEATDFLSELGWAGQDIHTVLDDLVIRKVPPSSLEAQLVRDAAVLPAFGVLGVAKAFQSGGLLRQPYDETISTWRRHLHEARLYTWPARQLAEARRAIAEQFLLQLHHEADSTLVLDAQRTHDADRGR